MDSVGCGLVGTRMSRGSLLGGTADNSPVFIAEAKNEWNYTSTDNFLT